MLDYHLALRILFVKMEQKNIVGMGEASIWDGVSVCTGPVGVLK